MQALAPVCNHKFIQTHLVSQKHERVCVQPYITDKLVNRRFAVLPLYGMFCCISLADQTLSSFLCMTMCTERNRLCRKTCSLPSSVLKPTCSPLYVSTYTHTIPHRNTDRSISINVQLCAHTITCMHAQLQKSTYLFTH